LGNELLMLDGAEHAMVEGQNNLKFRLRFRSGAVEGCENSDRSSERTMHSRAALVRRCAPHAVIDVGGRRDGPPSRGESAAALRRAHVVHVREIPNPSQQGNLQLSKTLVANSCRKLLSQTLVANSCRKLLSQTLVDPPSSEPTSRPSEIEGEKCSRIT